MDELSDTPAAGRNDNGPARTVLHRRAFELCPSRSTGRTVDVRIVPFGETRHGR
jgi:hypothetical protein